MNNATSKSADMIWNLGEEQYAERAVGFLKRFQANFCLFSRTVRQLYSNYDIHPVVENHKAVALPNPNAFHDTFSRVPDEAIEPTGLYIVPSEATNDDEFENLSLVFKSNKTGKIKSVPLQEGLSRLAKQFEDKGQFLPVIVTSDLRFDRNNQPIMHLHRLSPEKLDGMSPFQKTDIAATVEAKLQNFLEDTHEAECA